MTRHNAGGGYGHRIQSLGGGMYRLSWTFDAYIRGSRLRWPRTMQRGTDETGAERFAKKWSVAMPGARDAPASGGET